MVRRRRLNVKFLVHKKNTQYDAQHVVFTLHAPALDDGSQYRTMTIVGTPIIVKI